MSDQESNRMRRIVGWGIIGLIGVIGVSIALSLFLAPHPQGGFYSPFFFPFHFGWVGGILLIFLVFWIARWFFWPWRGGGGSYSYTHHEQRANAETIVRERYAKGEITKEQYEQMLHDLRQGDN
jgi:putative membrane protein